MLSGDDFDGSPAWLDRYANIMDSRDLAPLQAEPAITCQWDMPASDDEEDGLMPCGVVSRFVVTRSDGDQTFGWDGKHESCEEHLAEVVSSMIDGDAEITAVVTIRWDAPEDSVTGGKEGQR